MPPRKRPPSRTAGPAAPQPSATSYLPDFLRYLEAECGLSVNTVRAYRTDLNQFFEWYRFQGGRSLRDLNLSLLTRYLDHLHGRNLAATSIARRLASLKMFFRFLVLEGVLEESAVELLASPKLWRRLPKVLSPEMVDQLLDAPRHDDRLPLRDRAMLAVLYATGCRASELAGLRGHAVRLKEGYVLCRGKGNKERIVSLNRLAIAALQNYLQRERPRLVGPRDVEWLFVSRTGRPLTRITVWGVVKKYAARVGASRQVSPHTLRHSFATHMLAGGAEIRALQEMLGHASIRTTQVYTQVEHGRLKAVHERAHPRG